LPNISLWISRKHGEVNFYLTQLLTGHGCFRAYLFRFGHDVSPNCPTCKVVEDVEHVFFSCPRFTQEREVALQCLGHPLTPESLVPTITRGQAEWEAACKYAKDVLLKLREFERRRREL
jgi:hypothetical protein